jgi:hypothetical protein
VHTGDGGEFEQTGKFGEHHDFAAVFDREGRYKRAVLLDTPMNVHQIALFESGEFLVFGSDPLDGAQKMAILNGDGAPIRYIETPKGFWAEAGTAVPFVNEAARNSAAGHAPVFGAMQILPFRGALLIIPRYGPAKVFRVSVGGELERLPFKAPKDLSMSDFIPSGSSWYVRFRPGDADLRKPLPEAVIYQFDPTVGSVIRKIVPSGLSTSAIACEQDGEFLGFGRDDKGSLIAFNAKF